jgi:hypothetical protein
MRTGRKPRLRRSAEAKMNLKEFILQSLKDDKSYEEMATEIEALTGVHAHKDTVRRWAIYYVKNDNTL